MNLEDQVLRDAAEQVQCPFPPLGCGAIPGVPCTNLRTGEELVHFPAHDARLKAARNPDRST